MEWVETTARTVEEAVDQALDQLGVDEQEAEVEVLEEPRPGLFGRVRGQARIRARVRPKSQPAKQDRRDRRRTKARSEADQPVARDGGSTSTATANDESDERQGGPGEHDEVAPKRVRAGAGGRRPKERADGDEPGRTTTKERSVPQATDASVEDVAEQVENFLTGLVAAFGESADVVVDRSEDEVLGRVEAKLGLLIGPKGQTLEAIQELTRVTAQRLAPSDIRIKVDVGEYRAQRQAALERFARDVAGRVRQSGKAVALEPMPSPDRKIVHDALSEEEGVVTHSDGAEPRRRVVVAPADVD